MSTISGVQSSTDYAAIASGKKINSAADGVSELAIATKLETQSQGLEVGADNTKDGQNVLNIADGALGGIQDYLQRIRELSVKAMNGTNSASDLGAIQKEVDSMLQGIQTTAKGTEYNTMKLLDGSKADMDIASNPDGSGMKISLANSTLEALGIDGYNVTGNFDIGTIDNALNMVSESRSRIGASTNALEYAYQYNKNASLQQTSAQSTLEDLDIPEAVSDMKKNDLLEQYKNAMLKKQMEEESLVTKLL